MNRKSGVSVSQMVALIDYLEDHPDLAIGKMQRDKEGRRAAQKLWMECTNILNNVSPDCVQKSEKQWRLYYNDNKFKLNKRLNIIKKEQSEAGVITKKVMLSPLQKRLYNILRREGFVKPASPLMSSPVHTPAARVVQPRQHRKIKQEVRTASELSSKTNTLMEMERLHAEVVRKNTEAILENAAASRENAAASRTLASSIDRLTEVINLIMPSGEN